MLIHEIATLHTLLHEIKLDSRVVNAQKSVRVLDLVLGDLLARLLFFDLLSLIGIRHGLSK